MKRKGGKAQTLYNDMLFKRTEEKKNHEQYEIEKWSVMWIREILKLRFIIIQNAYYVSLDCYLP